MFVINGVCWVSTDEHYQSNMNDFNRWRQSGRKKKFMIASVAEPIMSYVSSVNHYKFERQGIHDNCNQWVCAHY